MVASNRFKFKLSQTPGKSLNLSFVPSACPNYVIFTVPAVWPPSGKLVGAHGHHLQHWYFFGSFYAPIHRWQFIFAQSPLVYSSAHGNFPDNTKLKPQTHGEREARSYNNFCAQQSDITISLAYELLINVASHQNWEKSLHLAWSRARYRARHVFLWKIASRFSLAVCLPQYRVISILQFFSH